MKIRNWLLYLAALLLLAIVFSYPLVRHFSDGMPYSFIPVRGREIVHQHPGDYIQLFYRFWLFGKALAGEIPFLSNPYEFSTPGTPPLFTTQGIPVSILFLLFSPAGNIFAYNALVLLSFAAAGAALALLLREITGSTWGALLCGALYACLPYRLGHLYGGHPGGFVFFLTPLSLFCFERAWRKAAAGRQGRGFLWGFASGLCVLSSALMDLHTAFYLGILLATYGTARFIVSAASDGLRAAFRVARAPVTGLAVTALASMAYLIWVKYFFLETSIVKGGRSIETVRSFSPRPGNLLRKSSDAERNIYLGIWPLLLAAWGFIARRREIRRGDARHGALLWLYFWAAGFFISYLLSLGTALERYLPVYSWAHAHTPFLSYSRTPSRAIAIASICLFVLAAYGIRALLRWGTAGKAATAMVFLLALLDYHPRNLTGISILGGSGSVYNEVARAGKDQRLLELPVWPGDSAWSAIYEYYVTLTGVPMVNGYNPAVQKAYVEQVFLPLRDLNLGEIRPRQHDLLRDWNVHYLVLHQEAFPRKVSRYPFRLTFLKLLGSPLIEFVKRDGPHHLFSVKESAAGRKQDFSVTSPIGNVYPSQKMRHDLGVLVDDASASSRQALCASPNDGPGWLWRGHSRIYPTGSYRVIFNLKAGEYGDRGVIARIEVYDTVNGKVVSERKIGPRDFPGDPAYRPLEIGFDNAEPTRVEFRISYLGRGNLCADYVYAVFAEEKDPRASYEAEDLFHIGDWVEDDDASGGVAVLVGRDEDLYMPVVNGPSRLYGPGRYRAVFRVGTREAGPGSLFRLEVASSFGGGIAERLVGAGEAGREDAYRDYEIPFVLKKATPLSFRLWHLNNAVLRVDRIEVVGM